MTLKTFRCTRNAPYQKRLTLECDRQGYYIEAPTSTDALARMALSFPDDGYEFTVEPWID